MKHTLLYIDDEVDNLEVFKTVFRHDFNIITADSARKGLHFLREAPIDLIISDYRMPETNGIDFLAEVSKEFPDTNRIILTAYSESDLILESINQAHVFGYLSKPWKKEDMRRMIDSALVNSDLKKQNRELIEHLTDTNSKLVKANSEIEKLKGVLEFENHYLKKEIENEKGGDVIIGASDSLMAVQLKIEQVSKLNTTVLILGETGTGKELVARSIHKLSPRRSRSFVKLNCASLPSSLVESELFGYEKGAFTGANQNKLGLFEIAHEGTIFLDEIGELPMDVQPKILRVLQDGEFFKVGGSKPSKVDVRIIAATNRLLSKEVARGNFRIDLFYRLNVFPITVPPLRDRLQDIPLLINHIVERFQRTLGINIARIPKGAMDSLMEHDWPGNIRELEAVIERSMITSQQGTLAISDLGSSNALTADSQEANKLMSLQEMEKQHITNILIRVNWKISGTGGAAEILKLNHNTLRSKMIKLGIKFKADEQ